jgi:hypothetical protein
MLVSDVDWSAVLAGSYVNVFHHLTGNTTKPATPKTHQKLEKLHLNISTTA